MSQIGSNLIFDRVACRIVTRAAEANDYVTTTVLVYSVCPSAQAGAADMMRGVS